MLKKYRMGFDGWGLSAFLMVMLPNFVWFGVPAPNDVLRAASVTPVVDAIGSVCQVLMVFALCAFIHTGREKMTFTRWIAAAVLFCLIYYVGWVLYYMGVVNAAVILVLTLSPCLALGCFAAGRKNVPALLTILAFTVCHLIYGVVNFIA